MEEFAYHLTRMADTSLTYEERNDSMGELGGVMTELNETEQEQVISAFLKAAEELNHVGRVAVEVLDVLYPNYPQFQRRIKALMQSLSVEVGAKDPRSTKVKEFFDTTIAWLERQERQPMYPSNEHQEKSRTTEETRFKIRRRSDGLFSTGGSYPRFEKKGKTWNKIGYLRRHLSMFATKLLRQYYSDCEIVEFRVEVSEVGTQTIGDEIRRLGEERRRKQEQRAEQARRWKEETERTQLLQLLDKYGDPREKKA